MLIIFVRPIFIRFEVNKRLWIKKYINCKSTFTKKNVFRKWKQNYKYSNSSKQFLCRERIDPEILWEEYLRGKQTYLPLFKKYNCSKQTIQRKIDLNQLTVKPKLVFEAVNLIMLHIGEGTFV